MHINCPHCQNPIDIVDEPAGEVVCPSCGSSFGLAQAATVSRTTTGPPHIGRFELIEPVGAGAFGTVYRARDTELDRIVALKVPRSSQFADKKDEDRFVREARAAAQLRHPGIVAVHEVARTDSQVLIVSEFVDGVSLSEWLSGKRPTFRETAELVAAVADALDYAHAMGVVHRDLKPANIMLENVERRALSVEGQGASGPHPPARRGSEASTLIPLRSTLGAQPRLLDFGLAKRDAGEITVTRDGQILGTPAYMSPEQIQTAHAVDGRADIYSLGVVLYELLTGELPFRGVVRMLLHQVLHDEPRPPRRVNDKIPRDLETICQKAMAKDPSRRYATGHELANDLRRWLAGEPIHARPVGAAERLVRWSRRNPLVAGLTAAVACTLLTGSIISTWQAVRAIAAERRADKKADEAIAEKDRADEQAKLLRRQVYFLHMNLAQAAWEDARIGRLLELLGEHEPKLGEPDLRGFEWQYWNHLAHSYLLNLKGHKGAVLSVSFSPDGRRLASASADQTVKVWAATTGQELLTLKGHTFVVRSVSFSPDGTQLASVSGYDEEIVKVWDATTGQKSLTLKGHRGEVLSVWFSPDGQRLASAGSDQTVTVWDATTGQKSLTLRGYKGLVRSMSFSPDGQRLASASHDGTVKLWDATTGRELLTLKGDMGRVCGVSFSPDGHRLASANLDGTVTVWDATTGQESLTLRGHTAAVESVSFSPDGQRLASASGYPENTVKLWDATTGQESLTLKGHTAAVESASFSPDGQRLASASGDGTVKVWDARPWTPELKSEQQAISLLRFLCAKQPPKDQFLQSIQTDATISEPARRRALELAETYWERHTATAAAREQNE
jgi:WD40 repeat protein